MWNPSGLEKRVASCRKSKLPRVDLEEPRHPAEETNDTLASHPAAHSIQSNNETTHQPSSAQPSTWIKARTQ